MKDKRPAYLSQKPQATKTTSKVKQVNDANFETEVVQSEIPVFVDFWAPWCGPCKMIGPVIDELAEEYEGRIKFVKLNTQDNSEVPGALGIRSIPTMVVFKGNKVVAHKVGAVPKDALRDMLDGIVNPKQGLLTRLFGGTEKAEA
jgi:thioredoxin 1